MRDFAGPEMRDIRRTELPNRDARQRIRNTEGRMLKGDLRRFHIADKEATDAEAIRRLDVIQG